MRRSASEKLEIIRGASEPQFPDLSEPLVPGLQPYSNTLTLYQLIINMTAGSI